MNGAGEEESSGINALQRVIRLAHSHSVADQKDAAVEISKLVEKSSFSPVSFGPLAHVLCHLVPSDDRTVATYAARGVKMLMLDDELRPLAAPTNIPLVLVDALQQWEGEMPCLRELLAALQTLSAEGATAQACVRAGLVEPLVDLLDTQDNELQLLSTATAANLLSFSDTLFLTDEAFIELFCDGVECLLDFLTTKADKLLRCYATAALANASAHPVLAGRIKELGGLEILDDVERQAKAQMGISLGGIRLEDCAEAAVNRLTGLDIEGGVQQRKFIFKWGSKGGAMMELLFSSQVDRLRLGGCFCLWMLAILVLFRPLLFPSHRSA